MNDLTHDQLEERMAQLHRLFDTLQQPVKPEEEAERPLMFSQAQDFAEQLGDYLRKLYKDNLDSHNANNSWLQQIDKNVKQLADVVIGAALGSAIVVFLIGLLLGLILKSGG